jgi:MSHA biogenesis protein MshP
MKINTAKAMKKTVGTRRPAESALRHLPHARPPGRQRGFALVAAIFLIVVLSSLGLYMVRISGIQHQTVNVALLGARAFHAARTGIEWGVYQALVGNCTTETLNLTEGGLNGFVVDVTCGSTSHTETGDTYNIFVIDVEARAGTYGSPDYVSRRIQATLTDAP